MYKLFKFFNNKNKNTINNPYYNSINKNFNLTEDDYKKRLCVLYHFIDNKHSIIELYINPILINLFPKINIYSLHNILNYEIMNLICHWELIHREYYEKIFNLNEFDYNHLKWKNYIYKRYIKYDLKNISIKNMFITGLLNSYIYVKDKSHLYSCGTLFIKSPLLSKNQNYLKTFNSSDVIVNKSIDYNYYI